MTSKLVQHCAIACSPTPETFRVPAARGWLASAHRCLSALQEPHRRQARCRPHGATGGTPCHTLPQHRRVRGRCSCPWRLQLGRPRTHREPSQAAGHPQMPRRPRPGRRPAAMGGLVRACLRTCRPARPWPNPASARAQALRVRALPAAPSLEAANSLEQQERSRSEGGAAPGNVGVIALASGKDK